MGAGRRPGGPAARVRGARGLAEGHAAGSQPRVGSRRREKGGSPGAKDGVQLNGECSLKYVRWELRGTGRGGARRRYTSLDSLKLWKFYEARCLLEPILCSPLLAQKQMLGEDGARW